MFNTVSNSPPFYFRCCPKSYNSEMVRKITSLVFIATAATALCLFLGAHWTLALSAGIVATSIKAYIIKRQQRNITPIVNKQIPAPSTQFREQEVKESQAIQPSFTPIGDKQTSLNPPKLATQVPTSIPQPQPAPSTQFREQEVKESQAIQPSFTPIGDKQTFPNPPKLATQVPPSIPQPQPAPSTQFREQEVKESQAIQPSFTPIGDKQTSLNPPKLATQVPTSIPQPQPAPAQFREQEVKVAQAIQPSFTPIGDQQASPNPPKLATQVPTSIPQPQPAPPLQFREQEVKASQAQPFTSILGKGELNLDEAEIERRAFAIVQVLSGDSRARYQTRNAEDRRPRWKQRSRPKDVSQEKVHIYIRGALSSREAETHHTDSIVYKEIALGIVEAPNVVIPQYKDVEECLKLVPSFEFMRGSNGKVYVGLTLTAETPARVIRNVGVDRIENLEFLFDQNATRFQLYSFDALSRKIEETIAQVRELLAKNRDTSKEPSDPLSLIENVCKEWRAITLKFKALVPEDDKQLTEKLLGKLKSYIDNIVDGKKRFLFKDLFDKCLETPVTYEILSQKIAKALTEASQALSKLFDEKREALKAQMKGQSSEKIKEALEKFKSEIIDEVFLSSCSQGCGQGFKDDVELNLRNIRTQEQIDELQKSLNKIKGLPGYDDIIRLFEECLKTRLDLFKEALKQSVDQYHERDRVAVVVANSVQIAFQCMNAQGKANYRRLIDSITEPKAPLEKNAIQFSQTALYDLAQRGTTSREEQILTVLDRHDPKQDYRFKGLSLAKYVHTLGGHAIPASTLGFESRPDLVAAMNQFSPQLSGIHCDVSLDQVKSGKMLDVIQQLHSQSSVRVFRCSDAQLEVSEGWRFTNAWPEGPEPVFEQDRRAVRGLQLHDIANGKKRTLWFELEPSGQPDKPIQLKANVQGKALVVGLPVNRQFEKSITVAEIPESNPTLQACNEFLTYQQTIAKMRAALIDGRELLKSAAKVEQATPKQAELIRTAIQKLQDVAKHIENSQLHISSIDNLPLASNLAHMEMVIHETTKFLEQLVPAKEDLPTFANDELSLIFKTLMKEINRAVITSYQPADRSLSALKCAEVVQDIIEKGGAFFHGSAEMAEKFFMNPSDFQIVTPFTKLINTITTCCWPDNAGKVSHIVAGYLKGGLFRIASPGGEYLVYSYFSFDEAKPVFKHVLFQIDCAKKFILAEKAHDKCSKKVYDSFEEIVTEMG